MKESVREWAAAVPAVASGAARGRSVPSAVRHAPWPVRGFFQVIGRVMPGTVGRWTARRMITPQRRRASGVESEVPDAGAARELVLDCGGLQLRGRQWGPVGRPPVLLAHGWEGRAEDLSRFVGPLLRHGFQVVAMDAPAHGRSAGTRTDVQHYARALACIADRLGPLHAVVAHSIGAAAASVYLGELDGRARALALIAPGGDLLDETRRVAAAIGLPPAALARLQAFLSGHFGRPLAACSTRRAVRAIAVPALVLHDEDDRVVPVADGRAVAQALPAARFVPTRGLGHRRILRDPAVIDAVVGFCVQALPASERDM